ncbi:MAG: hypothetical protein ACTHMG_00740 [Sphingomonas sp.]
MKTMDGVVTIVQESRFQLVDDLGVGHLFLLSHRAAAEPQQLGKLMKRQARVRVRYSEPHNIIGMMAEEVDVLNDHASEGKPA